MKYMQNGGFQNQALMKLTLLFTLLFLTAFWVSNFAIFFAKMNLTPASVQAYYLGSEEQFTMPKTYQAMLEVTHAHLPMMAIVVLLLTHLLIFAPYSFKAKVVFIAASFLLALSNEAAGWLVRFVHPNFAWMKVFTFAGFQTMLAFLLSALTIFLLRSKGKNDKSGGYKSNSNGSKDDSTERSETYATHPNS